MLQTCTIQLDPITDDQGKPMVRETRTCKVEMMNGAGGNGDNGGNGSGNDGANSSEAAAPSATDAGDGAQSTDSAASNTDTATATDASATYSCGKTISRIQITRWLMASRSEFRQFRTNQAI